MTGMYKRKQKVKLKGFSVHGPKCRSELPQVLFFSLLRLPPTLLKECIPREEIVTSFIKGLMKYNVMDDIKKPVLP